MRGHDRPADWNGANDVGLLVLRFTVGGSFFAHGMQKVFRFGRALHQRPTSWGVLALAVGVAACVLVHVLLHR